MPFAPHARPQFGPAARSLVASLSELDTVAARAAALSRLNRDIGDSWFPVYLKLLVVIGEGAPGEARGQVAESIAYAMQHGQTTGGSLSAWGIPMPMPAALACSGRWPNPCSSRRQPHCCACLQPVRRQRRCTRPNCTPIWIQRRPACSTW
jgi:hypothetical protein